MIQDDTIWFQGSSESFPDHQSSIKTVTFWRLDNVQKTPLRSHMKPQNHPKIQKSLVLAHNIHKDCPLGDARGFFVYIWCKALSFIICSEEPEEKIQGSTQIWFVKTFNNHFSASWILYQKIVDNYDRISLKFIYIQPHDMRIRWKLLPGPKRVKNDVQNINVLEKLKSSMIDPRRS